MNTIDFILPSMATPLVIEAVGLLFLSALLVGLIKNRHQRNSAIHEMSELRQDIRALTSAALGIGERVLKIERQNHQGMPASNKISKFTSNNETSYEQAINLVEKGADADDLVDTFGLSQGEADLVNLLHRINTIGEKNSAAKTS